VQGTGTTATFSPDKPEQTTIKTHPSFERHQQHSFYKVLWGIILSGRTWKGEFLNQNINGKEFSDSLSYQS
jgi:hypothetical protein